MVSASAREGQVGQLVATSAIPTGLARMEGFAPIRKSRVRFLLPTTLGLSHTTRKHVKILREEQEELVRSARKLTHDILRKN